MPRLLVAAAVRCSCILLVYLDNLQAAWSPGQLRGIFAIDWPIVIIWQFCVFHRGDLGLWKKFYIKWRVLGKGWSRMAPVLARGSPFPFLSLSHSILFFERSLAIMYILNAITPKWADAKICPILASTRLYGGCILHHPYSNHTQLR